MHLANTTRFLLIAPLVILVTLLPCTLAKETASKYNKSGSTIKPIYKAAVHSGSSEEGKHLFASNGCVACHSIESKGGCLGPPLDGIGAYRNKTFLLSRITDSQSAIDQFEKLYGKAELMPHPRIQTHDAEAIVQYLLTLTPPKAGFFIRSHNGKQSNISEVKLAEESNQSAVLAGSKLVYEHGCTACHSINTIGGHFAPNFDGIGTRRRKEYVYQRISNAEFLAQNYPDEYQARGNPMPPSNLTNKEMADITTFLMSLH